MVDVSGEGRISPTTGGFYPQGFHWRGHWVRVLAIEGVETRRGERLCRARTTQGWFELAWWEEEQCWRVRHGPGWLDRMRAHWRHRPRYPLPAWRRRRYVPLGSRAAKRETFSGREQHANGFIMVR